MKRNPFTLILHIALVIIMAGAIVTHFAGVQGSINLHAGAEPARNFELASGPGDGTLPFAVALDSVEIRYYPGTTTPMDFSSRLDIDGNTVVIAMNRVGEVRGWRFYQTGIGADSSTVTISYDPWGTGITYTGYALLLLGMAGFFFQRDTAWRALLRGRRAALAFLLLSAAAGASATPPSLQRPLAAKMGRIYVYWNDRVCPLNTMARDVTMTLYGSYTYEGLNAEQVLAGWLFYYDEWHRDYIDRYPEAARLPDDMSGKRAGKLMEKIGLVQWLGTGEAFRIYPYRGEGEIVEWMSLTGRRPPGMSLEQWTFMQSTMPRIRELLLHGKNIGAGEELDSLKSAQIRYAGAGVLPSAAKLEAERVYNNYARPAIAAAMAAIVALLLLLFPSSRPAWRLAVALDVLLLLYIATMQGAVWWISGHLPLSNGPETMIFMALAAVVGSLIWRRSATLGGCLCAVASLAMMVAAMGGRTPRIGALMPVLSSPLLSLHVMAVTTSYVLFLLMALLSAVALCSRSGSRKKSISVTVRLLLTPAVCLMGAGIFIGAVWANQSWGRYWGWDPKETCALVTWLVYALPVHWSSRRLRFFRRPKVLHIYLLLAILCVIFTYLGANYLLPGLHSYA